MDERYDGAQLPPELAIDQTEFNWYIFEGSGRGSAGMRHVAGLVSVHRTGPRAQRVGLGPSLLSRSELPSPLRELVPAWLPLVSPLRIARDDRPLFMVALYDLDRGTLPIHQEFVLEHHQLNLATFSVIGSPLEMGPHDGGTMIHAELDRFALDIVTRPQKPLVWFGNDSPRLRHGRIETHYVQRPRLDVRGTIRIDEEVIEDFVGDGAQDHQWMTMTVPNLKWMWPHLRLDDGTELHGYVVRDSSDGRWVPADQGHELARGGWQITHDGTVRAVRFDVRALDAVRTDRALVPTRFAVDFEEPDLRVVLEHVVPAPFLRMRAFGDVLDGGVVEGPARIVSASRSICGHAWVEVMNAATIRFS